MSTPRSMLASEMPEAKAIEGVKEGDGKCFEFLYALHKRRVYSLCLRITRSIEDAVHRKPFSNSIVRWRAFVVTLSFPLGSIVLPSTSPSCAYARSDFRRFPSMRFWSPMKVTLQKITAPKTTLLLVLSTG